MKLQAKLDEELIDIEVRREGDRVLAKVGDREYDLTVTQSEAGVYAVRNGSSMTEIFVGDVKAGETVAASAKGYDIEFELIDPKRLRGSSDRADAAAGTAEIKTAMPGKVVRILVEAGAEVAKGDGIIVVEAMKMQNEMKAPKDGIVKEIRVAEGSTVNAGEVLVVIE